jgi:hypothetical protein
MVERPYGVATFGVLNRRCNSGFGTCPFELRGSASITSSPPRQLGTASSSAPRSPGGAADPTMVPGLAETTARTVPAHLSAAQRLLPLARSPGDRIAPSRPSAEEVFSPPPMVVYLVPSQSCRTVPRRASRRHHYGTTRPD